MKTLKAKFIFWICLLFILIGTFIFISLSIMLPKKITAQVLKRDIEIAQYLSREVQESLLVNNKLALKLLLEDRLENLQDAIYIFISRRDDNIIASTFKKGFPKGLLSINKAPFEIEKSDEDAYRVEKFIVSGKKVYDIAIPLLKGELGALHLGVSLESSKTEISEFAKINYYVASVIFIGLGMGILIFALLGIFLSNRIIKLKDFAASVGNGILDEKVDIKTKDELGSLAASFNEMVKSLKEKIETIKRLSCLEERNRIAFELHDGLAQNLADIIKRLELCERLFKFEPSKALGELGVLKNNTREVLTNIRRTIFNLKLTQDSSFNLKDNLTDCIKNLQERDNINVKLDISCPIDNIAIDKAEIIFYIIREALTNIKKHSAAENVIIYIGCDNHDGLTVHIKDDGQGFDVDEAEISASNSRKFGIIGMRKRAVSIGGVLSIRSKVGEGSDISFSVSLKDKQA
jgi:signal transduction histidine kinase